MKTLSLIALATTAVFAQAQTNPEKTELEKAGFTGAVKQVKTTVYDAPVFNGSQWENGTSDSYKIVTYDAGGRELVRSFYTNGKETEKYERTYNADGKETRYKYTQGKSAVSSTTTYNKAGLPTVNAWIDYQGKPGEKSVYTYNAQNLLIDHKVYEKGKLDYRTQYKYDANGNKIDYLSTDAKGKTTVHETYTWNAAKQMIAETNEESGRKKETVYTYDEKGNMTERNLAFTNGGTTSYYITKNTYNSDGDIISTEQHNAGTLSSRYETNYGADKKVSSVLTYGKDGKLQSTSNYNYDEKGNFTEEKVTNAVTGETKVNLTRITTYDEKNNKIKEVETRNGKTTIQMFEIVYF